MGQVDGKIAVVAGGASGIGAACAVTLAREGAKVVLTDIDDASGQELAAGIRSAGGEALYLSLDVTNETRWQEIVVEFERRYDRLDIVVANAGIGIMCTSIAEMSLADWRRQTAVNLDAVFLSVNALVHQRVGDFVKVNCSTRRRRVRLTPGSLLTLGLPRGQGA